MSCGTVFQGSSPDCENPESLQIGGTQPKLGLINHANIDSVTYDSDGRVTAITLLNNDDMHLFTGFRNDVKKSDEVVNPGVGINMFRHMCGWVVYERTQVQKNNLEKVARGKFAAIIENKGKDADAFEVLGLGVGMEIVAEPIRNAHENGGYFIINLQTPEDEFEAHLPASLGTDYADAVTLFDGLLPAGS